MEEYTKQEKINGLIVFIILVIISLLTIEPLPDNCHRTQSVDIGGSEIECD